MFLLVFPLQTGNIEISKIIFLLILKLLNYESVLFLNKISVKLPIQKIMIKATQLNFISRRVRT